MGVPEEWGRAGARHFWNAMLNIALSPIDYDPLPARAMEPVGRSESRSSRKHATWEIST